MAAVAAGAGGAMVAHLIPSDILRLIMPVVLIAVAGSGYLTYASHAS